MLLPSLSEQYYLFFILSSDDTADCVTPFSLVIPAQAGVQNVWLDSGFRITALRNDSGLFVIPANAGIQNMCLDPGFRVKRGMTMKSPLFWMPYEIITA